MLANYNPLAFAPRLVILDVYRHVLACGEWRSIASQVSVRAPEKAEIVPEVVPEIACHESLSLHIARVLKIQFNQHDHFGLCFGIGIIIIFK